MSLQRLSVPQLAAAAAVYTRAFMDDPISLWIAPDPVQREHGLPLCFRMAMQYARRLHMQDMTQARGRNVSFYLRFWTMLRATVIPR